VTPPTAQRAALKEHGGADARPIVDGEALYIKDSANANGGHDFPRQDLTGF
jgi:hypothetical protein